MTKFWEWYKSTAFYVGIPVLFFLLVYALQKTFYTASCRIALYKCENSIESDQALVDYMGDLIAANKNQDIVVRQRVSK